MMTGDIYTLNDFLVDITNQKEFYELVHTHCTQITFPSGDDIQILRQRSENSSKMIDSTNTM